jgi:hypothetical protein
MDPVTEIPVNRFKTFVIRHKVALAVTVTALTCLALNQHAIRSRNEFLKDHDLYNEFYNPPEDE